MAQYTPQDLIDNLNYLNETKQLIKSSIINKGQEIDDNDTFRSYADKIDNIATDTTATENDIAINKSAYVNGNKVIGTYDINDTYKNILYNYIINAIEGENINITDSANLPMILEPHGNLVQETRDGYNLGLYDVDTKTVNNITFTHNDDNSMKVNGTSTNYVTFKLNQEPITLKTGTYTLALLYNKAIEIGIDIHFDIRDNETSIGNILKSIYMTTIANSWKISEITLEKETDVNLVYYVTNGAKIENQTVRFMLLEGTYTAENLPEYEAFGQMPSTEFPSKVKIVEGDNGILIEESETASDIVEPQSQNLSLSLPEGIKLYGKEDGFVYLTEEQATELELNEEGWYVYNEWGEITFTGNEILIDEVSQKGDTTNLFALNNTVFTAINNYTATGAKCNYFKEATANTIWVTTSNDIKFSINVSHALHFRINMTLAEFKTWLEEKNTEGNPLKVVGKLVNPTYTKITDSTLISQLEALKKVFSHYPVTNIDSVSENENAPIYFNVTYFKIK